MPTTCPRCGTRSAATSESCRDCGRDLYRVSYPAPTALGLNLLRTRAPTRAAVGAVLLLVGAGITTGVLLQGDDDEGPVSQDRLPATSVPREPVPSVPPSSPEATRTKAPPKPAPTSTPPPSTPSATPSPTQSSQQPIPGISEAEDALELARKISEQWSPSGPNHWEQERQEDRTGAERPWAGP